MSTTGVWELSKKSCNKMGEIIKCVYGERFYSDDQELLVPEEITLENLDDYIDTELDKIVSLEEPSAVEGRIGPKKVIFDVTSNVGGLVIDKDHLGLSSQSNYSSIRAGCCVFKGKWQYELMLGSKGVMQLGWATMNSKFSQEKGVGDTTDSYSYDGNRIRKWNIKTFKYGEPWLTGDIIGCGLDLDNGLVHFYRNGVWLGQAFDNVRIGPTFAYFPAVSLSYNENIVANFGAKPLRYPVSGFQPLESPPFQNVIRTQRMVKWLEKIVNLYASMKKECSKVTSECYGTNKWSHLARQVQKSQLLLVANPLIQRISSQLTSPYIIEACLLPLLFKFCEEVCYSMEINLAIESLFDIFWALLEPQDIHQCIEHLIIALLTGYRFSPISADFGQQKHYLTLTLLILQHDATRQYLLQNVLFDKIKFPVFLEIKPLDNAILSQVVPVVWYDTGQKESELELDMNKVAYKEASNCIKTAIAEVELIQLNILKVLFKSTDVEAEHEVSSRFVFLSKFREFLKENSGLARIPFVHLCPLPVALAFFHRLVSLLRSLVEDLAMTKDDGTLITSENLFVPSITFYDDSITYFDCQRIGGIQSHLSKTLHSEVTEALTKHRAKCKAFSLGTSQNTVLIGTTDKPASLEKNDYLATVELLDGIIRLYQILAHKHLEKMYALKDSMKDYINALKDTEKRLKYKKFHSVEALLQTKKVFLEKLTEQARHQAWINAVIYSSEKQHDVYWLLQMILNTLNDASSQGSLFTFVPDFYVDSCIKCCNALRTCFSASVSLESIPGYEDTLINYGSFLAENFADTRVVNAELKDGLVQALAAYVCYPTTLKSLESMNLKSQIQMVRSLLQPYENRAWAQSNWILVRLWKGCGFGFRYSLPPHVARKITSKHNLCESASPSHQKPCPSSVFQMHIATWLDKNPREASAFIGSVLTQLNWAFSEFIGMLQEIQNAANRPERVFIDSRQLKICATCFDLALALLRVLEMIVKLSVQLFTDWTRPSAEIFLTRLCQLSCQVLNRITSKSGCFYLVVKMEIPGLETVHHFPILAAVSGILVSLILENPSESQECAISCMLNEPSFLTSSLEFMIAPATDPNTDDYDPSSTVIFSFRDYPADVNDEELNKLEILVNLLRRRYSVEQADLRCKGIDEDDFCTICYATPKSAKFFPCGHESCRACICLHLLNHKECFFCKSIIEKVESNTGEILYTAPSTR